jgi:replicative DNA helicase
MDELFDKEAERNVIKAILHSKDFCKYIFTYKIVTEQHFTDLFHRDVLKCIEIYYSKYGYPPSYKNISILLSHYLTRNKEAYKTFDQQKKIWISSASRLYNNDYDLTHKESDLDLLEHHRKARLLQKFLTETVKEFESENYSGIVQYMNDVNKELVKVDNVLMKGNIVDDYKQHIELIKQKKKGEITPIYLGFSGVKEEKDGSYDVVKIDDFIGGGFYPSEMTLIIGEQSVGKSFLLMEAAVYPAMMYKKNTILFTIEMNKIKQQMRIYSRITGIEYEKFKKGTITKEEIELWREKIIWWKKNCGILHVVSFDRGATVVDIENELKEAENHYGQKFDLISIDYLNDMKPLGKFQSAKSWDAMGEISWDLTNLAKRCNDRRGIPIITANQKKTTKAGTGKTSWEDAAFSAMPTHHATVGIGISQDENDKAMKRIKFDIWKMRDDEKGGSFYVYPDFAKSRISSVQKMALYYDNLESEKIENEKPTTKQLIK